MAGFKDILKHSGNYMIANLATRALAFISIPVYTRLLTEYDYGTLSVFLGLVGILNSVLTCCTDQSISRYFFDQKTQEDFKQFVGTSSIIALLFFTINSSLLIFFAKDIALLTGLNPHLIYLIIPVVFINVTGLTFEQIYQPLKKSKLIAVSSLTRVYLGFGFSIAIVLIFFTSPKYYGPILGQILAGIVLLFYWIKKIRPFFSLCFKRQYLKYIFTFSVPLIPYALSGVIIEQFGKIILGRAGEASEAGFYSLALSIASLTAIVTHVTHQAWYPYYIEYMNAKNYRQHDQDIDRIFRLSIVVGVLISAFGREIGLLLAKHSFTSLLYLIPIFVLGYIFHQFAYVYMRNFSFVRRTAYMSLIVITSGIINISLNVILLPIWGEVGAAISFTLSYIWMGICAWFISGYIIKLRGAPIKLLLKSLLIYMPTIPLLIYTYTLPNIWISLAIKVLIAFVCIVIIIRKERKYIVQTFRKIVTSKQT